MTNIEIAQRIRMTLRAFQWKIPLPLNCVERFNNYDKGDDRQEELWYHPYRLGKNHERRCAEQTQVEHDKWVNWISKLNAE